MKVKRYRRFMTSEDCVDVTLYLEHNTIFKFALNYRAYMDGRWVEVFRVDNFHGYLHEQRFWISPAPKRIESFTPLNIIVEEYLRKILLEFGRYRKYIQDESRQGKDDQE
jgi:hypothetical protein